MKRIAILATLAVAGCAGVADLRDNPPALQAMSKKPPAEVAACIGNGWSDMRGYRVTFIPGPDRSTISVGADWTEALAYVYADGRVEVRRRNAPIKAGSHPFLERAQACI